MSQVLLRSSLAQRLSKSLYYPAKESKSCKAWKCQHPPVHKAAQPSLQEFLRGEVANTSPLNVAASMSPSSLSLIN